MIDSFLKSVILAAVYLTVGVCVLRSGSGRLWLVGVGLGVCVLLLGF